MPFFLVCVCVCVFFFFFSLLSSLTPPPIAVQVRRDAKKKAALQELEKTKLLEEVGLLIGNP